MIKLLFWGIAGYFIYRFFQMRAQIKEARRNDAIHQQHNRQSSRDERDKNDDYIDYEEVN